MARKPIIAGNWKMNMTNEQAKVLIEGLKPLVKDAKKTEVVICVPYTDIATAVSLCTGSNIKVGAENVAWAEKGAFTGEISADMLLELGTEYVIIGHSERRQYFGETDSSVNARLKTAVAKGLKPIVCVGETLEQREKNRTKSVIRKQVTVGLADLSEEDILNTVIAYEPVWAIGTGKTATSEQAEETIKFIRGVIAKMYTRKIANKVRIQYGGSMNPKNVKELMAMPNIDGGLIGGASLKAEDFSLVVNFDK
ncbi:MAG: triose-phosphate isomerase [Clostridia bacterium]|nr:triose-phosphate isomerase [Clostridia bacterium]